MCLIKHPSEPKTSQCLTAPEEVNKSIFPALGTKRQFVPTPSFALQAKKPKIDLKTALADKRLIQAVRSPTRSKEQIEKLLNNDEDINQQEEILENSPLHYASFYNCLPIVKLLVSRGANLNLVNKNGLTPLMWAIEKGHTAIAKFLLSSGAAITIADSQGFTALHKAVLNGNNEILAAVIRASKSVDKFNINAFSGQGLTALHQAAYHGNARALQLLCDNGADVNVASTNKTTALHMAASRNQTEIVRVLLASNASVDLQDAHSRTALHYACIFGHAEVTQILHDAGANHSVADFQNQSPLSISERDGMEELTEILQLGVSIPEPPCISSYFLDFSPSYC